MMRPCYFFAVLLLITMVGCDHQKKLSDANVAEEVLQADSNGQEKSICTPEWFNWVNQQVLAQSSSELNQLYPNGLPEVGSGEWFEATDVLTADSKNYGVNPKPGSEAWCFMIQQRLNNPE